MRLAILLIFVSAQIIAQSNQGLRFIENKGQWNSDIDFQARVPGGRLGVSSKGFSVVLLDMDELDHRHLSTHGEVNESSGQPSFEEPVSGHYFQINLVGAFTGIQPIVESPWEGYYNYFQGSDSCKWATNAQAFATIVYTNIYEGIDFRVSSVGNNLKYDFIVHAGADPSRIKIEYCGVEGITKKDDDLEIHTAVGVLTELKPYTYQQSKGNKHTVSSEYQLSNNEVSFSFPEAYDECEELIIDPLLIFSTYSGSTADNWGSTATPGEHGTLYSAGVTIQSLGGSFPATAGAFQTSNHGQFDMAIIKYDSGGTKFLYATHLGGVNNDSPESLVVDKVSGDLIVLGISSSPNYPTGTSSFDRTFNGGTTIFNRVLNSDDQWDIVLTRLSSSGNQLVGSTFLGGSGNDGLNHPKQSGGPLVVNYGDEMRGDVITDELGNVYISSVTSSSNFPIVGGFDNSFNGNTDGLIVKMTPDLSSIIWSSYVGGTGYDAAYSIKFDNNTNIVLAGGTSSNNFPVTSGSYQPTFNGIVDGWIGRVSADGNTLLNATFTGTFSFDQVYFIDLNASGEVFCYGQTAGPIPVTAGVYNNPNSGQFVQKFSTDLSSLQFSTVFGSGSTGGVIIPNISPTAFLVNDCDNIYMAGWGGFVNSSPNTGFWLSTTNGMPVTNDAFQKTTKGSDFYFIVLNGNASKLVYSTYLGGNSSKTHVDGGTSRFDKFGIVYHAVCSGCAFGNETGQASSDFPTTPNAKSRLNRSQNCNNAAFKFDLSSLRAIFDTNNIHLTMPGFNNVCYPDSILFQNFSTGGRSIEWDFDDGTIVTQKDTDPKFVIHQFKQTGKYRVKLTITDLTTCSQVDSTTKVINYFKPTIIVGGDGIICDGSSFQLNASGGIVYNWVSEDGTFSSQEQAPTVNPNSTTTYFVTVMDGNGCSKKDTVRVSVTPNVHAAFQTYDMDFAQPGYNNVCYPDSLRFKNLSVNGEEFLWDFDDGTTLSKNKSDTLSIARGFQEQGVYRVKLIATNLNTCNKSDSAVKIINYFKDQIQVGDDAEICEGTEFQLTASGGNVYAWTTDNNTFTSSASSPTVRPTQSTNYFVTVTDLNSCVRRDTIKVSVLDSVDLKWQYRLRLNCTERPSVYVQNLTTPENDVTFKFDLGDGTTLEDAEHEHFYAAEGTYQIKLTAQRKFCSYQEAVQLPVYKLLIPNVFTPDDSPGYNDFFQVGFNTQTAFIAPGDVGLPVELIVINRWGKQVLNSLDYKNDWNAENIESGVYYIYVKVGEEAVCKNWLYVIK